MLQVKKGRGTSWDEEKCAVGGDRPLGIPTKRVRKEINELSVLVCGGWGPYHETLCPFHSEPCSGTQP